MAFGPAVQAYPARTSIRLELVGELRREDDLPAEGSERFTDEIFVGACQRL